jgi:uncharacterized membrane protein
MATLTAWKFDSADGAADALAMLNRLQKQQLVQLQDAALVTWPEDAKKPAISQLHNLVGAGTVGGAFWGAMFGLLFLVPLLGIAIGAGIGAIVASTADIGIDDSLVKELREKIVPGSSALLLLSTSAVTDRVLDEMKSYRGHADLIETNLTREQEAKLRRTFAQEPSLSPSPSAAEEVAPVSSDSVGKARAA